MLRNFFSSDVYVCFYSLFVLRRFFACPHFPKHYATYARIEHINFNLNIIIFHHVTFLIRYENRIGKKRRKETFPLFSSLGARTFGGFFFSFLSLEQHYIVCMMKLFSSEAESVGEPNGL